MENLDLFGNPVYDAKRNMKDYFMVAPFSVINTVDSEWQKRKKRWNNLINDTGQERKNVLAGSKSKKDVMNAMAGSSILDACLAELMIKWFTEENYNTFDCFAGDTVFGFVSGWMNRPFTGIELRENQAKFNQQQCDRAKLDCKYICDAAQNMDKHIGSRS